jgi:HEAT repeat protein
MGPAWEERLAVWSCHSEPRLRIRALAALARRGDPAARDALLEWAEGPYPLPERAEVISALGELDAAAFLPLLVRGLALEEQVGDRFRCAPVAEEAALALARLGTPEALTALTRAYLSAETRYLLSALEEYLTAIIDAEPGTLPDLNLPRPFTWHSVLRTPWRGSKPRL